MHISSENMLTPKKGTPCKINNNMLLSHFKCDQQPLKLSDAECDVLHVPLQNIQIKVWDFLGLGTRTNNSKHLLPTFQMT